MITQSPGPRLCPAPVLLALRTGESAPAPLQPARRVTVDVLGDSTGSTPVRPFASQTLQAKTSSVAPLDNTVTVVGCVVIGRMLGLLAAATALAALAHAESPFETVNGIAQAPMRGMDRWIPKSTEAPPPLPAPVVDCLKLWAPTG
jgi:hypothetical protein